MWENNRPTTATHQPKNLNLVFLDKESLQTYTKQKHIADTREDVKVSYILLGNIKKIFVSLYQQIERGLGLCLKFWNASQWIH